LTEWRLNLISSSPEGTRAIGKRIGTCIKEGAVLALQGELGSGKTCLVQGIATGLGVDRSVPVNSPSFVIINEYPGPVTLYHFDLYRVHEERELWELGWEEYLARPGVIVIEWAERTGSLLPDDHIRIALEITGESSRRITISGRGVAEFLKKWGENSSSEKGKIGYIETG
jgi:tRNA threonylcarbamoyladenosine biosynthesis protein TsaE